MIFTLSWFSLAMCRISSALRCSAHILLCRKIPFVSVSDLILKYSKRLLEVGSFAFRLVYVYVLQVVATAVKDYHIMESSSVKLTVSIVTLS